ncbi:putative uncharacterized protein DDB_G0290989 [Belonocnema kinseyi]|uniref:putative uncharacterized protein DDB_G0290989 n=1 Tax=Belonocnema kinseyi TaxID=2817044 RepID=UPI00143D2161|nr:putative uncharacterized protein DDB_G0290989 [Belonocnema kinseyi]
MKFFDCFLLFTFVIFLSFVRSSSQPSGRKVQRGLRLIRRMHPGRHFRELAIVDEEMSIEHPLTRQERLMIQEHHRIPDRLLRPQQASPRQQPRPCQQQTPRQQTRPCQQSWLRQQQTPSQQPTPCQQTTVHFKDGDFMYRGPFPIGKVKGGAIYEHPVRNGQQKIVEPETGDKLLHSGACIGKYDNGWQRFYQQG